MRAARCHYHHTFSCTASATFCQSYVVLCLPSSARLACSQVDGQALLFVLSNHFINEFIGFGFDFSNEEIAERYPRRADRQHRGGPRRGRR